MSALNKIIIICEDNNFRIYIKFNLSKSNIIYFCDLGNDRNTNFKINKVSFPVTNKCKHLRNKI